MDSCKIKKKLNSESLVTAYAALRPRYGFPHPNPEHMKDTYILVINMNIQCFKGDNVNLEKRFESL